MLTIKPFVESYGDCFDNLILTLCHAKNAECTLMHIEAWGFTFEEDSSSVLGDRIYAFKGNAYRILEECHGISVQFKRYSDKNSVYEIIRKELLSGFSVMLETDIYFLPWQTGYHKIHNHHFILIVGMEDNELICLETNPLNENQRLSLQDLEDCSICLGFIRVNSSNSKNINCRAFLNQVLQRINGEVPSIDRFGENYGYVNMFDKIRQCAEAIRNQLDFEQEIEGYGYENINMVPLFWRIKSIGWSRYQFAEALKYMEKSGIAANHVVGLVRDVGGSWDMLGNRILKYFIGNRPMNVNEMIYDKLMFLCEKEEMIEKQIRLLV